MNGAASRSKLCGICLSSESVNIEIVRSSAQQPERKGKTHEQTAGTRAPRFHRITTNLPFSEWPTIFPNAATATALIDRLVHHAEIITLEGVSYRRRVAEGRRTPKPPPSA
jgi:hypothetical protein